MILPNQPEEEYHAHEAASRSTLCELYTKTPFHARYQKIKPSKFMDLGSAVHMAVLEPHRFETDCFRGPEDRRGNKWKDAMQWCDAYGKLLVTEGDFDKACAMRDAAHRIPTVQQLTAGELLRENSAYWIDEETQVPCRIRPDARSNPLELLADVKTCGDASKDGWARSIYDYGYHVQDAMYSEGWEKAGGGFVGAFLFVLIENEFPHATSVYELTPSAVAEGRAVMRVALTKFSICKQTGIWPSYPDGVQSIDLPRWGYKETTPPTYEGD